MMKHPDLIKIMSSSLANKRLGKIKDKNKTRGVENFMP